MFDSLVLCASLSLPQVLLLNLELELKSEKENAEIRLEDVESYQSIVDAEWSIICEPLPSVLRLAAECCWGTRRVLWPCALHAHRRRRTWKVAFAGPGLSSS